MVVMTMIKKEKTVFTKAPRVIILVLLTVTALTRTNAFAPTPALLTSGSAVSATAMATRSPSALLAKNTSFRYCSLTGTVIAKKKKTAAAGRQKKNDVMADDRANKDRVFEEEQQQQTVQGTAGHDDSRGRLTTGTTGTALTWHTIADHDEDEPLQKSRPSSSGVAFGWNHQEWYVALDDRPSLVCYGSFS
jgi:hypothetical protein